MDSVSLKIITASIYRLKRRSSSKLPILPTQPVERVQRLSVFILVQPECDVAALEPTPAMFFYIKTEKKFLSGNTAKLLLRCHPDYYVEGSSNQSYETEYLTWDATKTYTMRFIWNGQTIWMLRDGVVIASKTFLNSSYAKESINYICLGNMQMGRHERSHIQRFKDLQSGYGPAL